MKKRQFSLVELLVVIAILAILMTLLFPSISKVKAKAKMMNCFNKAKTISNLNQRYAAKHNGNAATTPMWHASEMAKEYKDKSGNTVIGPSDQKDSLFGMLAVEAGFQQSTTVYRRYEYEVKAKQNDYDGSTDGWEDDGYSDDDKDTADEYNEGKAVKNERRHQRRSEYWLFICDNTVKTWAPGHDKWQVLNGVIPAKCMDEDLEEKRPYISFWMPMGYTSIGAVRGEVSQTYTYWFDYDAVNKKYVKAWSSRESSVTPMSSVRRPSARIYHAEGSERNGLWQNWNNFADLGYVGEDKSITGLDNTDEAYIPGAGGGEEPTGGYARAVRQAVDFNEEDNSENIMRDVEEGRHDGYTIASFFDGHVEAISAKDMYSFQKVSNSTYKGKTRGYLALATSDDDEYGR